MKNKIELNKLLKEILKNSESRREELIKSFQNIIWKEKITGMNEEEMDIYVTLAYDLDFYEPNEKWRKEDPSYYDETKLISIILKAMNDLKNLKKIT